MMGSTHALIGATTGYLIGTQFHLPPSQLGLLFIVGGIVALVPDIDHPQSRLRQRTGFIGDVLFFWLNHRGITHTLLMALVVAILSWVGLRDSHQPLALTIGVAYGSHLLADLLTRSGIPLLIPFTDRRFRLLGIRTGSWVEHLLCLSIGGFLCYSVVNQFL